MAIGFYIFKGVYMKITRLWGVKNTIRSASKLSKLIFLFIPLFGFLSVTLGVVSFYGQETGDMSLTVDNFSDSSIRIAEDSAFTNPRTVIRYPGMTFVNQASYNGIMSFHYQKIMDTDGYFLKEVMDKDREVTAFTFYVKNMNETATINRINYKINLSDLSNHIEEHLRIMVVVNGVRDIYEYQPFRINDVETLKFKNDTTAVDANIYDLAAGDIAKVSVIMWIDGYLEEYLTESLGKYTEEELLGGSLKLNMVFSINNEA